MFNPSRDDVRRFFCDAWTRHRQGSVLTPLEAMAIDWIRHHPEYQDELSDTAAAVARWSRTGEPCLSRLVTVTGDGVRSPCNVRARIGTPLAGSPS